jgi:hypothetical protein
MRTLQVLTTTLTVLPGGACAAALSESARRLDPPGLTFALRQ